MKGVAGAPWIRISRRRPVIWPFSIVMITAVPKGRAWYGIPRANHGLRVSPGTFGARLWALFVGNRRCSVPFLYTWFFFVVRPTSTSRTCNRNGFPSGQSVTRQWAGTCRSISVDYCCIDPTFSHASLYHPCTCVRHIEPCNLTGQ
jgi:hypothetical protein